MKAFKGSFFDKFSTLIGIGIGINLSLIFRLPEFTHNGNWRVVSEYRDGSHWRTHQTHWTVENISQQIDLFNQVGLDISSIN